MFHFSAGYKMRLRGKNASTDCKPSAGIAKTFFALSALKEGYHLSAHCLALVLSLPIRFLQRQHIDVSVPGYVIRG
jgi:hypothetical protein